jgi:2-polyprenyl-3-methyl-5-hydroxy-6-metoxy-1,4-benzoquinol methylase
MKIAYVATNWDFSRENGVTKKIAAQIKIWDTLGAETKLFALSLSNTIWEGLDPIPKEIICSPKTRPSFWQAVKIRDFIKAWQPDIVYWRFSIGYPALGSLMSSFPTILEINTYDIGELIASLPQSWLSLLYQIISRNWVFRKVHGAVFVTQEIADHFRKYPISQIVISNGIDLSSPHSLNTKDPNLPIQLVLISSDAVPWQGVDKLISLAHSFPKWKFEIIGKVKIDTQIPNNVILRGLLDQTEYDHIMTQSDIGIGHLSLYKNNMEEACPLKVREYLSYGLPCIIGYRDTDFPDGSPFILRLPNTPDNVQNHLSEIEDFATSWKNKRVNQKEIMCLDLGFKEKQRINFFQQVIDSFSVKSETEGRFKFGKNWQSYAADSLTDQQIQNAVKSLRQMLRVEDLQGQVFMDIGCGSGLSSLAACLLGAEKVIAFDYDYLAVQASIDLRNKANITEDKWYITQGNVLDQEFLSTFGKVDVAYAWGVLHHTGNMWEALNAVVACVKPGGLLAIAIYNNVEKGLLNSARWWHIKRLYNQVPAFVQKMIELGYLCYFITGSLLVFRNPIEIILRRRDPEWRGMDFWHDLKDWVGGYPFEYATAGEVLMHIKDKFADFNLVYLDTHDGHQNNQFTFRKSI